MHKKRRYVFKCIILFLFSLLFILLSIYFKALSKEKIENIKLNYNEESNIDYNVYLKDNPFFEEKFLNKDYLTDENKTIISQLIDYIDINFEYSINYSDVVDGNYSYYIKSVLEANKSDSTSYWSKEYILTEKKELPLSKNSNYTIRTGVKINYDEYNDLLNEFKKKLNLPADGDLEVSLVIENNIKGQEFKESTVIDSIEVLTLPLTSTSTQISVDLSNSNKANVIKETHNLTSKYASLYKVLSFLLIILAVIILIKNISNIANRRIADAFEIKLNKILSTYDSIIIRVKTIPNLKNFNVIVVNDFSELIDAHNEVRMPINYYSHKNKHIFILVNENIMWLYQLKEDGVINE